MNTLIIVPNMNNTQATNTLPKQTKNNMTIKIIIEWYLPFERITMQEIQSHEHIIELNGQQPRIHKKETKENKNKEGEKEIKITTIGKNKTWETRGVWMVAFGNKIRIFLC